MCEWHDQLHRLQRPMKRYQILLPVSPLLCIASKSASHSAKVTPRRFPSPRSVEERRVQKHILACSGHKTASRTKSRSGSSGSSCSAACCTARDHLLRVRSSTPCTASP